MNCPKCQIHMREREKDDLIIDICPQCRGVWLDAGELDKLSIRERGYYDDDDDDRRPRERRDDDRDRSRPDERYRSDDRDRREEYSRGDHTQPRKKGFLSTIFESMGEGRD